MKWKHKDKTRRESPPPSISSVPVFFSFGCWVVFFHPNSSRILVLKHVPNNSNKVRSNRRLHRLNIVVSSSYCFLLHVSRCLSPMIVTSVAGECFAEGVETSKDSALQSEFVDQSASLVSEDSCRMGLEPK